MSDASSKSQQPDYGTLGNARFVEFLNDAISTNMGIATRLGSPWIALWQGIVTRRIDRDTLLREYIEAVAGSIDAMFATATFPVQWATHLNAPTPTVLLTLDSASQASAPVSFSPAIDVEGLTLECSDLYQIGGTAKISGESVRMLPRNAGRVVQVAIAGQGPIRSIDDAEGVAVPVDVAAASGTNQAPKPVNGLPEGLYLGAMSAAERPNRRPLGMLAVLVAPADTPMYPML
jgi:hypothetical protein